MCHVSRAPHSMHGSRPDGRSFPREEASQFSRGAGILAARTGSLTVTVDQEPMTHGPGRRSRDRQARVVSWERSWSHERLHELTLFSRGRDPRPIGEFRQDSDKVKRVGLHQGP